MLSFDYRPYLAVLIAVSLFLGACNRDAIPTMEQQLMGRWEWQQTLNGSEPALTPVNTGHQMVVEFDRRGRACFYQDGSLVGVAAFSIRHKRGSFRRPGRHIIQYRGYEGTQYYSVAGNILHLEEMRGKPGHHSYVRLPSENDVTTLTTKP